MKGLKIDRRRRVLSEDWSRPSGRATATPVADLAEPRRYTAAANIENHPQISDFVPRRLRTYLILTATTLLTLGGLFATHLEAVRWANSAEAFSASAGMLAASLRLQQWLLAMLLGLSGLMAMLVYSLRRHRVDDYRARYRVWLGAIAVCWLASANAVAGLHRPLAEVLSQATGWSLLPGGAGWWLIPTAVIAGWLGIRVAADLAECRTALLFLLLAALVFGATIALLAGWEPLANSMLVSAVATFSGVLGAALLALALTLYARFLVLDVQGLIEHRTPTRVSHADDPQPKRDGQQPAVESATPSATAAVVGRDDKSEQKTKWVDGSVPEADLPDDARPRRPLSKAQRKRQRQQKTRRAA